MICDVVVRKAGSTSPHRFPSTSSGTFDLSVAEIGGRPALSECRRALKETCPFGGEWTMVGGGVADGRIFLSFESGNLTAKVSWDY